MDDLPEIGYRHTCTDRDAMRLTRIAMRYWLTVNRSLWVVLAVESIALVFVAWKLGSWWWLAVVPAFFLAVAAGTFARLLRAHRRTAAPGTVLGAGYDDSVLIVSQGEHLAAIEYSHVESVERGPDYLAVKVIDGPRFLIPAENAPAAAEARIRAGMPAKARRGLLRRSAG